MPGALAAGQLVDERYALEEPLDEDALGTVWRALDRGLGRHVCVRDVVFPGESWRDNGIQRRQALDAARTAIRLDHPGAVHVYDAFFDGDHLVVVTELVPARSLASLMARKGAIPLKRVAIMGLELLEPLVKAHAIGVVHGSVTPSVVLVPERDRFLLTGFGLAPPFLDATSTVWVQMVGTPACISPEQASHRGSSPASDLWSFGATLYYASEGTHAFAGETPGDVLDAVVDGAVRPPSRAGKLAPLLMQLLERDPEARPAPDEIRDHLTEIAGVPPLRSDEEAADGAAEADGADHAPTTARRRNRRERRRSPAEADAMAAPATATTGEEGVQSPTVEEHDWNALVAGAAASPSGEGADTLWRDWTPDDGALEAVDVWLPPADATDATDASPPPALGATGAAVTGIAPDGTTADPAVEPAIGPGPEPASDGMPAAGTPGDGTPADGTPGGTPVGTPAAPDEPPRFRSTPSWPPPPRRKKSIVILCSLVVVVMVALLVTNGRIGRTTSTRSGTTLSAQQRPVLATDPASVPGNWIAYRHPAVDLGASYPPGWTVREEGSVVTIRDPTTGTQLRIDYSEPPGPDPEQTWTNLESSFSAQHPTDYRRLQLSPASYLGHPAALWEFTYVQSNTGIHAVDLGFLTKKYRFALFFESPVDAWQTMLPTFHGFLSSIKAPK